MWLFLATMVVSLVVWLLVSSFRRPNNYPPGPPRIPVVGQIFALDRMQSYKTLDRWAAQYGPVFSVKLGSKEMVVLSSADLIREAFSRPEFSVRPESALLDYLYKGKFGFANSSGALCNENRLFTLRHLKNFGIGRSTIEDNVMEQIKVLMDREFIPKLGQAMDVTYIINICILNTLWTAVVGEKLQYGDKKIEHFFDTADTVAKIINTAAVVDFFPWLINILPDSILNLNRLANSVGDFRNFIKKLLQEHRVTYDDSKMRDYLDYYIKKMKEEEGKLDSNFFEWQLLCNVWDLFVAGGDTTATTLRWAFLFLCGYPQHQMKLQKEIDDVIGKHRQPKYRDKDQMPYMEAFIAEVQRVGNIAPTGGPLHAADQDTTIAGYTIPKGTIVAALLYRVHSDATVWKNPRQFDPRRFLDIDGKFVNNKNLMPFLVGRRQCLGENLARVELFLFLTSFLQRFRFSFPKGVTVNEEQRANGRNIAEPQFYQLIVELRSE